MSANKHPYYNLSRRDFLKLSMMTGFSAFLASCASGATPTAETGTDWLATGESIPMDVLLGKAQEEGSLTTIALPHDWANYGEMIETYKSKFDMEINELNPDAGSSDELEAIRANKDSKGPQAPDVIDIGVGHTETAMNDGLVAPYKVSAWDTIPEGAKDPDGHWWAEYYGVLAFEVIADEFSEVPMDWEDLLKPEYKGKVAMAGDVLKSNQSVQTVFAAGLSRYGKSPTSVEEAVEAAGLGLQFWKEVNDAGNFIPVIADQGKIAQGETPIVMEWDYLALANRDR